MSRPVSQSVSQSVSRPAPSAGPRLPDFVVLGQGKAGTSLIYRVFQRNPQVGLSRPKELFFFNQHFDRGLAWYLGHFAHLAPDTPCIGEISPAYLAPEAVARAHATLGPGAGMIYVLRHPIEQAYSRYLQNICAIRGEKALTFQPEKALRFRLEQVHAALETLYRLHPHERILPLLYERDIDTEEPAFEARICDFLGLAPSDHMAAFRRRGKVNAGVMPRFVYGGPEGLELEQDGETYRIPAHELVFCAQPRNSRSLGTASPEEARAAHARAAAWTDGLDAARVAQLHETLVAPFAARLEQAFGLDLDHWRAPARAIGYDPAPPPPAYLAEGSA